LKTIQDWLDPAAVSAHVSAATRSQALSVIAEISGRVYGLRASRVFDALQAREAISPTGVGRGVAIPHAQIPGLDRLAAVFIRLQHPIAYEAVDEEPVDLLFALLAPTGDGSDHLRGLAKVSRLLRRPEIRDQLRQARNCDALHALLTLERQADAA
jgi:PTS system nitrogen regulatory IIA component